MRVIPRQGQFWWVKDALIVFPESREREPHESRGAIIIEGNESLARGGRRVQIIPTSSRTDLKDTYDVVIPSPPLPGGRDIVALVQHLQPILRDDLTNMVTPLRAEWVERLLAVVLASLGVQADDAGAGDPF